MSGLFEQRLVEASALPGEAGQVPEFGVLLRPRSAGMHVGELPTEWLKSLARLHHLVLLRGFEGFSDAQGLTDYCAHFGEIMQWPFGAVLELREQADAEDHIFASSYVPLHWDGMYLERVPEFQVFQCVAAPGGGQGGRTTFSSTPLALRLADADSRALWARASGRYRRSAAHYSSVARAPILERHPQRGFPLLRFCEPPIEGDASFINPSEYRFEGITEEERAALLASLRGALYDPRVFYAHRWQTGDLAITDNFSLLHGREAFTSGSERHLRRVHIHASPAWLNPHRLAPDADAEGGASA
ncbi:TauD/TfdA family dioxygenase [Pseudomonas sp. RIT-PI-AD]|uniref:TauD/TfdA dioxygenase family protein n=1 Tax=Pseudomonas sp. RIT-PI-AD TaxID=3035294 RepID=UPI0023EE81DD|nr:TauD/TfdA family dioxygenase [Pseudomonas sp. RIT-PI-AD]